jgi:hypothetical protein
VPQLRVVETRGRMARAPEVEVRRQLVHREPAVVAAGMPQADEIVADRSGQESLVTQVGQAGRALSFRQRRAAGRTSGK